MARSSMVKGMARALCSTIMTDSMRATGRTISNRVQATNSLQMDQCIRGSMWMGSLKGWGSIVGQTDNFIRGSGSMDSNMVLGCGRAVKETAISGSGGWAKLKAMGCMSGSMGIDMRENSNSVWSMAKVRRNLQMEISIKDSIREGNQMATESTIGKMAATSRVTSKTAWDRGMVCGKKGQARAISMKESTYLTRNMAMVFLRGRLAISIRAIISRIWGRDMARCIGMTAVTIKGSGRKECKMVKDWSIHPKRVSRRASSKIMCWFRSKRSSLPPRTKGWTIMRLKLGVFTRIVGLFTRTVGVFLLWMRLSKRIRVWTIREGWFRCTKILIRRVRRRSTDSWIHSFPRRAIKK